jgi:hypothetical protein
MCALCGLLRESHWAEGDSSLRGRLVRARIVDRVLSHFGLELSDWAGRVYLVRDRKGRTVVVEDLGGLWAAAEQLAGRPLDPLDAELVAALRRG